MSNTSAKKQLADLSRRGASCLTGGRGRSTGASQTGAEKPSKTPTPTTDQSPPRGRTRSKTRQLRENSQTPAQGTRKCTKAKPKPPLPPKPTPRPKSKSTPAAKPAKTTSTPVQKQKDQVNPPVYFFACSNLLERVISRESVNCIEDQQVLTAEEFEEFETPEQIFGDVLETFEAVTVVVQKEYNPPPSPPPLPPPPEHIPIPLPLPPAAMATPEQIRLLLKEALGNVGPALTQGGALEANQAAATPTLAERLAATAGNVSQVKQKQAISKPPGPTTFQGDYEENAMEFKESLEDYIESYGFTTEPEKIRMAKMFLKGPALVWFKQIDPAPTTLQDVWTAFENKYIKGEAARTTIQDLLVRQQRPGEDPLKYAEEIQRMALAVEWAKPRIIQHIVAGLQPEYKKEVIVKGLGENDLDGLLSLLRKLKNVGIGSTTAEMRNISQSLTQILTEMKSDKIEKKLAAIQPTTETVTYQQLAPVQQQQSQSPQQTPQPYQNTKPYRPPPRRFRNSTPPRQSASQGQPIIINAMQPPQPQQTIPVRQTYRPMQPRITPVLRTDGCWTCGARDHFQASCPNRQSYPMNQYPANQTGYNPVQTRSLQQPASGQGWNVNRRQGFQRRGPPPGRTQYRPPPVQTRPRGRPIYKNQGNY